MIDHGHTLYSLFDAIVILANGQPVAKIRVRHYGQGASTATSDEAGA